MKEMVGGCCVCSDERGWAENPLVYCDGQGCTVAVHQACYGIVTVPTGPWFCRKCESQERAVRVRCELCPIKDGALKRTDNQAWAHVVCALYIPEVRFGNVSTMEPIILSLVPSERYNKTCYICDTQGKGSRAVQGACMNCNKPGCKMQFHVTCAQGLGLLCEEAGNYMDNVKYCGYCQHHYSKLKKGGNVKQVPPYKPVPNDSPEEREEGGRKRKSQGGKGGGRGRNATPSPNLNKQGAASPSPGSESGDHSRASTPAGSNGTATKELLPPPSSSSSVIKDSKDKDKKEEKGKESEKDKDKDKKDSKDVANSNISSTASTTSAKFTTSNFVETGPQNSVSSPGPMGPSVSSSANSIVVSVPLTAAVSLPNTASQQVSSAINQAMSNSSSTPIVPSAIPADPHPSQISSSSGNSSNKLPASENLGKRSSSAISMKESPPSSPEPVPHRGRPKGRRGHNTVQSSKEEKEQKIFQNGVTSINNAPHMLGHQLNPSSSMAQKMSDTLTAELEAHSVFSSEPNLSNQNNLVGPQLPTKVLANARAAETRSTPSSGVIPQTLDQLLERQWEQGSQFLMEQAQHFDIASLLTCLHQLRSENTRLEEHIRKLLARRDHLLAVNARLAIPLTQSQPPTPPHGTPGLPDGIGAGPSPGPLTPQGGSQGPTGPPSQSVGSVGAPHVAQGSPQLPSQGAASVSTGHHVHQSSHSQNHTQSHSQSHSQGHPQHLQHSQGHPQSLSHLHQQGHSQGHPQGHPSGHPQGHPSSHSQGHPPSHSQGHPQGLSQGHPQGHPQGLTSGHSQGHPSGHPQGHPQSHSQGHPQGHPQTLLQNPPSQSSRQTSQRSSYGQPSLENGLPSESSSMLQGYGAHQRPQPSPNIRHTQSGSPYMMSQTPPTSNPSVVRSSPVSSEQGRRW